ncbi:MAG: type II secretion system protein N [Thiobacillaceae bacterium]|nr:type II secretion system protein N [Thiobacillaceae bacterium]MDW8323389.1 type II secretion system protein N [Burkholderiales bacterium]
MRPTRAWIALGLALYLLGLIVLAPAALVARALEVGSGGRLRAQAVEGGLWRGAIGRLQWSQPAAATPLGRLEWRWQPQALLRARLAWSVRLKAPGWGLSAHLGRSPSGLSVEGLRGEAPAWLLGRLLPALSLVHPEGTLRLQADSLRLAQTQGEGQLSIDWLQARSALVRAPLGSYRLQAQARPEGGVRLVLTTLHGPLQAQGEGLWRWGGGFEFQATLQPPAAQALDYAPALRLLARPDAGGVYRLQWRS